MSRLLAFLARARSCAAQAPACGMHKMDGCGRTYFFTDSRVSGVPKARIVLGRAPSCDIRVKDATASWFHAVLVRTRDGYVLHDCHSTNGVFIDGRRLRAPAVLRVGMLVQVGDSLFMATDAEERIPVSAMICLHGDAGQYVGGVAAMSRSRHREPGFFRRQVHRLRGMRRHRPGHA